MHLFLGSMQLSLSNLLFPLSTCALTFLFLFSLFIVKVLSLLKLFNNNLGVTEILNLLFIFLSAIGLDMYLYEQAI